MAKPASTFGVRELALAFVSHGRKRPLVAISSASSRTPKKKYRHFQAIFSFAAACFLSSCGNKTDKPTVTVYTSLYENVIAELAPILERELPDIKVVWFQSGSEEVAAKVNSEIAAGKIQADIIMTSDPFWYEELKTGGYLLPYVSPAAAEIPAALKDPDSAYVTVRVPVMVLTANGTKLSADRRPTGFSALASPDWKDKLSIGNPLQSGSMFTAVAALSQKYGWDYFKSLRANNTIAAGGNSAVLNRVTSGEREIGMILLENLLKAKHDNPNTPAEIVYPSDGAILVPSPIAIVKTAKSPDAAKRVYDFMFSDAGQRAIVGGNMYSAFERIAPPPGAKPWKEIYAGALVKWSPEYLRETLKQRDEIKNQFQRIMLE